MNPVHLLAFLDAIVVTGYNGFRLWATTTGE